MQEQEGEASPLKEDPRDFALWKAHKAGEDTLVGVAVGAGPARAGTSSARRWRSSSSAPKFDIHLGGLDLVFPHHENELAQSRGAGREFARIWMHNGMLELTGEKMSKSIGNIATLRDVVERWGRETVLLYFLTGALAQADRLLRRDDGAGGGAGRDVPQRVPRRRERRPGESWA